MKKLFKMLCVAALPALMLGACSKDDDPNLSGSVQGTYPVAINAEFMGNELPESEATVVVTPDGNDKIKLELQGFSVQGIGEIPITLNGLKLAGDEGNVTVAYSGPITSGSETLNALGNLEGTLNGTIKDKVMNLVLVVLVKNKTTGEVGLTVNVKIDTKK